MNHTGRNLFILLMLVLLIAGSCVPNRKIVYVQDDRAMIQEQADNMYFIDESLDEAIRQGDELYIRVTSADETQTNFNQDRDQYARDPSLVSYTVDQEGYIKLPYVERIKLTGLTLMEASDLVEQELSSTSFIRLFSSGSSTTKSRSSGR